MASVLAVSSDILPYLTPPPEPPLSLTTATTTISMQTILGLVLSLAALTFGVKADTVFWNNSRISYSSPRNGLWNLDYTSYSNGNSVVVPMSQSMVPYTCGGMINLMESNDTASLMFNGTLLGSCSVMSWMLITMSFKRNSLSSLSAEKTSKRLTVCPDFVGWGDPNRPRYERLQSQPFPSRPVSGVKLPPNDDAGDGSTV